MVTHRVVLPLALVSAFLFVGCKPAIHTWGGQNVSDEFGSSVDGLGDIDGDAHGDAAIGAPGDYVELRSGAPGGSLIFRLLPSADSGLTRFGAAVAGLGDVDGDEVPDLLVGAPGNGSVSSGRGFVDVYSGATGTRLHRIEGEDQGIVLFFGRSVSAIGDVDGDDRADLLVGSPAFANAADDNVGAAFVFSGATAALLFTVEGEADGDELGHAVAGIGDVDDDAVPDFAVAAPQNDVNGSRSGRVYVRSGVDGALLYAIDGELSGVELGRSLGAAGDVDGDDVGDFIVGHFRDTAPISGSIGGATVYSGVDGSVIHEWADEAPEFGQSVDGAGDTDGDGVPDLIVGGLDEAVVFSGATGSVLERYPFDIQAGRRFGFAVAGGGDINADGRADVLVGAPDVQVIPGPPGPGSGAAFAYSVPASAF